MSPVRCSPEELRTLFLFEELDEDQLSWVAEAARVESAGPGPVYQEGMPAAQLYVLLDGELVLTRRVGEDEVELVRTSRRGVYAGAVHAYLGDRVPQRYANSMRASARSSFLVLDAADFAAMVSRWFPMGVHLLEGLLFGLESTREAVGQRERLMALGTLSAGLTHELNNPAVSALRSAEALREVTAELEGTMSRTLSAATPEEIARLTALRDEGHRRARSASPLRPMDVVDREDALADWLDAHGVEGSWELAAAFVQADVDVDWLESTAAAASDLDGALRWFAAAFSAAKLLEEIQDSARRISTLVDAAKQYSQIDRAPFQDADVRQLLDSTLVMFQHRIDRRIDVVRDYAPDLPPVPCCPAELNQVWTNLIDNALDAMGGHGTLTVGARREGDAVLVEVGDTGPGVPEGIRERIFEPFFSTKPVGQGTGLGLDISWRIVVQKHRGGLRLAGGPGDTRFQVRLPGRPGGARPAAAPQERPRPPAGA